MPCYSSKLLDHFRHPRNAGALEDADGVGEVANPQSGDTTRLAIRVADAIVQDIRWQTRGCSGSIAASSAASELVKGKPLAAALDLTHREIALALGGLPPAKAHCAILAVEAVRAAVADYQKRVGPAASPQHS